MTNPYPGPPSGPPSGPPYGGGSYPPYGGPPQPMYGQPVGPTLDGISIAALVCSLTCCAAPIGVGLGIAGLVRTSRGRRTGRWAAITGLVIGIVVSLAGIAFLVFAGVLGFKILEPYDARVGQCVNDSSTFDELLKADCDGGHDGEIVWAQELDLPSLSALQDSPSDFCASRNLAPEYAAALKTDDYLLDWSSSGFDRHDPEVGDWVACWIERRDGAQLDAPIADSVGGSGQRGA